jgi:hypothetical protein
MSSYLLIYGRPEFPCNPVWNIYCFSGIVVYKVVDARGVRILLRAHVKNLQEGLNIKFFVMKTNNNERPVLDRSLVMDSVKNNLVEFVPKFVIDLIDLIEQNRRNSELFRGQFY